MKRIWTIIGVSDVPASFQSATLMLESINWRLVFRHVIPAVYIPLGTFIGFAIFVAVTGLGTNPYVNEIGYLVASSSFVLVFANVAARDIAGAPRNVAALATICWLFVAVGGAVTGGWRQAPFWLALGVLAGLFSIAAFVGLRWARRWARWRAASSAGSIPS